MSAGLDDQYDFALFGTSLPLSILSAALAKAGYSVLHVDDAEHYGGPWASITLLEFFTMARKCKKQSEHPQRGIVDMEITFPSFANRTESDTVPEELAHLNRHFAISLAPVLLPCAGPTIDVMIRSKVASYCTFRLLQETAIFSPSSSRKGYLHKVPSSKEDIFKSKSLSLVDKRRLMKLLQQAATENAEATPSIQNQNFFEYLTSEDGLSFSEELARDIGFGVALSRSYKGQWTKMNCTQTNMTMKMLPLQLCSASKDTYPAWDGMATLPTLLGSMEGQVKWHNASAVPRLCREPHLSWHTKFLGLKSRPPIHTIGRFHWKASMAWLRSEL